MSTSGADQEFLEEEGEEVVAAEGSNRTFIILVGALGGLLALGICAFVAWAFLLGPQMRAGRELQNQAILATNTAVAAAAAAMAETATTEAQPTPTETIAPTDTPRPTPTVAPTATPVPETPEVTATPAEVSEAATATSPSATATRRPTATPKPAGGTGVPDTGIGTLGTGAVAAGLLLLLIVVRRVRRAA